MTRNFHKNNEFTITEIHFLLKTFIKCYHNFSSFYDKHF